MADVNGPVLTNMPRLRRLAAAGTVNSVVPGPGAAEDLLSELGSVDRLAYEPMTLPASPRALVRALRREATAFRAFRDHLRERRPDLVLVMTTSLPGMLLAARLVAPKVVLDVGEVLDAHHEGGRLRGAARLLVRAWSALLADLLVCCSHLAARGFRRLAPSKARTVYPGIPFDLAAGDGDAFLSERGLREGGPVIGVAGNVTPARGQDVIVRALPFIREAVPNARVMAAGLPHRRAADDEYRRGLTELADRLGVAEALHFLGRVDDMNGFYAACDVVVNPARFLEPFGRVAIEALAANRPVVATRVGAIPEVLEDERHALLVPPEDPAALAAAVVRILSEPGLASRLVANGRDHAEREFAEEHATDRFVELVDPLLPSRLEEEEPQSPGAPGPADAARTPSRPASTP